MLSKQNRLPAKEFPSIFNSGRKVKGDIGMLIGLKNDLGYPRFGFVVSKKVGNSVIRHRMTRRLRALASPFLKSSISFDFQYIAFRYEEDFKVLEKEFLLQIKGFEK